MLSYGSHRYLFVRLVISLDPTAMYLSFTCISNVIYVEHQIYAMHLLYVSIIHNVHTGLSQSILPNKGYPSLLLSSHSYVLPPPRLEVMVFFVFTQFCR